ncbi:MAG: ribulose-phosphate 3-epimerase [Melioribacteraceae bacterium]|nr:ribulose-phosphate 3-epimerase [Melioribacteraceae bacterium]MCF8352885.1 ribulose-phosphate 3-epimerase [Melioribacteraceae bacterium]MCF8393798.1 ribulose-phosphate 3-epimerase [Melioribacteraceae bacterium]MCF8417402.1 ribulose-phosphate 3-epimerase [Melioribacteraceae bacterium]
MKLLAPSILAADFSNLRQQIRYTELGGADWIHCDIMDGKFVPNISFGPSIVSAVKRITDLTIDVHLMIENPDSYIEDFINAGADIITVHQEEVVHLDRTLNLIKSLGAKAAVAVNPATPLNSLDEILDDVDMILLMSVNPGFGGQNFIGKSIKKIEQLSKIKKENNNRFLIQVDGGIDKQNISQVSNAGCDVFVAGSAIFKNENITAASVELKKLIT